MTNEQMDGQGLNKRERGCLVLFYLFVEIVLVVCYALFQDSINKGQYLSNWVEAPASFLLCILLMYFLFRFVRFFARYRNNMPFDGFAKCGAIVHSVCLAIVLYFWGGGILPPPMNKTVLPGEGYKAVAGDASCTIALTEDGHIVGWGDEKMHRNIPGGSDYSAIDVGTNFCLALRADGCIAVWGDKNGHFISMSPITNAPAGKDFIAISISGGNCLALKRDGSMEAWGDDWEGVMPEQHGDRYTAIDTADHDCLAQREDGALIHWTKNKDGKVVRSLLSQEVAKIATMTRTLIVALKTDGSIKSWSVVDGIIRDKTVPPGKDFQDIAAGYDHGLALKNDGRVVGWSDYCTGAVCSLRGKNYRAIAAGGDCSFAIDNRGRITGWGVSGWGRWSQSQYSKAESD